MATKSLPRLSTFMQERLDRNFEVTDDSNCTICLEPLLAASEKHDAVVRLPCQHIFHLACLLALTEGYTDNRNKCPNCRSALFELNLLPPEKEALKRKDGENDHNPAGHFDTHLYTRLLAFTDAEFDEQLYVHALNGEEDYTRIPKSVRSKWTRLGLDETGICEDHAIGELAWLELTVARRVMDQLKETDMEDSWSGRIFAGALKVMEDMYDEQFHYSDDDREPEDRVPVGQVEEEEEEEEEEEIEDQWNMEPRRGNTNRISYGAVTAASNSESTEQRPISLRTTWPQPSGQVLSPEIIGATLRVDRLREDPRSALSAVTQRIPPLSHQPDTHVAAILARIRGQEPPAPDESHHEHFARIRESLQRDRVIVLELRNVASADVCGERERRIELLSGDVIGVVKDVDGYTTVGSLAVFWRWKA
jgi:hypothetical protein